MRSNWRIVIGSIAAYFSFILLFGIVFSPLGIVGQFLGGLLKLGLMTLYYGWLAAAIQKERLAFKSMLEFDWSIFFTLVGTGFVLWIIEYLLAPFAKAEEGRAFYACAQLAIFLLLNALPEVILIQRLQGLNAIVTTSSFCQRNWIEWFIPLLILFAPLLISSPYEVLLIMSGSSFFTTPPDPLLPPLVLVSYLGNYLRSIAPALGIIGTVLAVVIANWFMLFRAALFSELSSGTRRKRMYEAKFK